MILPISGREGKLLEQNLTLSLLSFPFPVMYLLLFPVSLHRPTTPLSYSIGTAGDQRKRASDTERSWRATLIKYMDIHRKVGRSHSVLPWLRFVLFSFYTPFFPRSIVSKHWIQRSLKPAEKMPYNEFSHNFENPNIYIFFFFFFFILKEEELLAY